MRWGMMLALGLIMALLHRVTAGGPLEARATLALGFLLLAAHLGGDIAKGARLPRLTGYMLVGFATGPRWLGLVRGDETVALRFFSDAGLALLALAAGSELRLEALRAGRAALARVATAAVALPFVAVSLVMLSASPWFPLTVHLPLGDRVAVALTLGAFAAASSPAVTMAMIGELDARGPVARALLGTTVVQDVATVILLTAVLAAASDLTGGGKLNSAVAGAAALNLAASLAVGALLGYLLGQYLQLIQRDTTLFLVTVAFVSAEAGRLIGLEPAFIALAAGFYLENVARVEGERVRSALKRSSPLASMVFFVLAGAGLELRGLADLWPWALLLIGLRAASLHYGLRWAGRHPAVTPALAAHGWMGLLSQAGIILGLAHLVRRAFPGWGVSLETLIVAGVGINEVAGPIGFRKALVRAGEVAEEIIHGGEDVVGTVGAEADVDPRAEGLQK